MSMVDLIPYKNLDSNILNFDFNKTNDTTIFNEDDLFYDNFFFKNKDT
jgi:hypothetical protein